MAVDINSINGLYTFEVNNPTVISGEFINMKLTQIVGYNEAVIIDSNIPELMRVLNYLTPADKTYYVFTKDNDTIVICKDWVDAVTVVVGDVLSNMTLNLESLEDIDRTHILNFLATYSYKYTLG